MRDLDRVGGHGAPGAHAPYHDPGRCPACHVPVRAPHLNSCGYTGLWLGTVTAAVTGHPHDDDWGDDEERDIRPVPTQAVRPGGQDEDDWDDD